MENKNEIIVSRKQCVYCPDFWQCPHKLWIGKPTDCPKNNEPEKKSEEEKENGKTR